MPGISPSVDRARQKTEGGILRLRGYRPEPPPKSSKRLDCCSVHYKPGLQQSAYMVLRFVTVCNCLVKDIETLIFQRLTKLMYHMAIGFTSVSDTETTKF
jgi:hypothetical protein